MFQYDSNIQTTNYNRGNVYVEMVFFSIFFLINPLFALIALYLVLMFGKKYLVDDNRFRIFVCVLVSLYVSFINSTKSPVNDPDLAWYIDGYLDAGNGDFMTYLLTFGLNGQGRELAFPFLNYIIYLIIGPSPHLYVMIVSFLCYFLINISIVTFCKNLKINYRALYTGIFIMSFLPMLFAISAVVLRQFFAGSLLIYILVQKSFYNRNNWFLAIFMCLSHTSTLFFIPFIYLPYFEKRLNIRVVVLFALGIIFVQDITSVFLPFFSTESSIGYALERANTGTTFELPPLTIPKITLLLFMAGFSIYTTMMRDNQRRERRLFNTLMFLVLFILLNLDQVELTVRFNFYCWLFLPFIIGKLSMVNKQFMYGLMFLSLFVLFIFIITLRRGVWIYKIDNIWLMSTLDYLHIKI